MAKVKFSRNEFEKHIKISPEIEEKIRLFGTPLESVTNSEIEIEIFPNRPDLLSLQGYLRSFKAFLGKDVGLKRYSVKKPEKNYKVIIDSAVKEIRPYSVCAIIKGLALNGKKIREIIELQEKLHSLIGRNRKKCAIGVYPLEKIKMPITYTALKPGEIRFTPLDSEKEMTAEEILERHPKGREYNHLMKGLKKYPVFIDSSKKFLSMPPIINSKDAGEINEKTEEMFVECSGSDISVLKKTLNILVTAFSDMDGKIYGVEMCYPKKEITPNLSSRKIKISLESIKKLLGLDLKEKDLEKLLPRMGFDYRKGSVFVPAWRSDILHEVDIIEDVAIAYGYDKIIPEIPPISTIGKELESEKIKRNIAEILSGLGLLEVSSYHLIKHSEIERFKSFSKIEVESSKTEYKYLRPNLVIPALRILSENKDHEYPQKIFEIGPVFSLSEKEENGIRENEHLIIAISPSNFTHIKQILEYLINSLGLEYSLKESQIPSLTEGRAGRIAIKGKDIGFLGEVHPETLIDFHIKMPVSLLEMELNEIINILSYPK